MTNSNYKCILFLFAILIGTSSITALSIGSGIGINLTVNSSGMNYTNETWSNYTSTNYTANQTTTTTNPNNQTTNNTNINTNNSTINQTTNQEQTTNQSTSKKTITKQTITETTPANLINNKEISTDNQDKITGASISSNKNSQFSKIMLILPTMILTDLFVITYALYKNKGKNNTNKKRRKK